MRGLIYCPIRSGEVESQVRQLIVKLEHVERITVAHPFTKGNAHSIANARETLMLLLAVISRHQLQNKPPRISKVHLQGGLFIQRHFTLV